MEQNSSLLGPPLQRAFINFIALKTPFSEKGLSGKGYFQIPLVKGREWGACRQDQLGKELLAPVCRWLLERDPVLRNPYGCPAALQGTDIPATDSACAGISCWL